MLSRSMKRISYIPIIGLCLACNAGQLQAAQPASNEEGVTVEPTQAVVATQPETPAQHDAIANEEWPYSSI